MNNENMKTIINRKNMSIRKLSRITKLNDSNLGKIINGKTNNPGINYLLAIAKALDLDNDEFAELCDYKVNKQSCIPLDIRDENTTQHGGNSLYGKWITGICPDCKQDVQLGMNFCPNCGKHLIWKDDEK